MSSSTPLLPRPESSPKDEIPSDELLHKSLDEVIEWCVGGLRWRQFIQALIVSLAWFLDGEQACISVFSDAEPTWHCTPAANSTCSSSSDICDLPGWQWAWDGSPHKSIISEWSLECASSFITGLPTSCFYMGCLLGGFIFATLADSSLGRKNLLIVSCLVMSVAAFVTTFSTNIWMYSALRLVSGLGRASIGTCAIVLATEMVTKKWRGFVGMMGLFIGTLGLLSLPLIAYVLKAASWRYLYLTTSLLGIVYCALVYFFTSESPKWLFMQGREVEAVAVLERIVPEKHSSLKLFVSSMPPTLKQDSSKASLYSSMKDLLKIRWTLQRLLKIMVVGFGIGMVYYGMLLGVGNLGLNIYLGVLFNGVLIIPSYFASYFLIDRLNRRSTLLGFTMLSGVLSIVCAFIGSVMEILEIAMELASFFCACVAYNVLVIYTIELFPTRVRNSATSMMRQAIILGVLFDPTLISAGKNIPYLAYLVFGVVISLCGLVVIFLPETRGVTLSDSMEEDQEKDHEGV